MPRKTFTFDGVRYSVTRQTDEELAVAIAEKKRELANNEKKESNMLTREYVDKWFTIYKEPYISARTKEMYITTTNHVKAYIGSIPLKKVTSTDIQQMVTAEYNKGRSKSHMDKLILTVKQIFKRAYIDKKIRDNPTIDINVPKLQGGKRRAITDEERKYILDVAKTHRHGRWIRGMLYIGFRPEETAYIQGKDIDLDSRTLHIRGTKSYKADRYVPIPDLVIDDFTGFSPQQYVYSTVKGNPPNKQRRLAWWNAFKRDVDIKMGATVYRNQVIESVVAEDLVPYCLRHTYGTDAQAAGVPIDVLADLMGHEDIETTRKYYIHENAESREAARRAFEYFYKSK